MSTPGSAKTNQFQFTTATVCVATTAQQLAIDPALHSIGLVKNLQVTAETTRVDLTQGISNQIVSSVVNGMNITANAEVYEYTAKNLSYGLGIDGAGLAVSPVAAPIFSPVAPAATTVVAVGDVEDDFPVGSWFFIQEGTGDAVHVARVSAVAFAASNTTITFAGFPVPAGMNFTIGGRVGRVNKIDADPTKADTLFAVRVIGTGVNDKRPMILHFPKVRITRGFSMSFTSDNFSNLPFEFVPLTPTPQDIGYSGQFNQIMSVLTP